MSIKYRPLGNRVIIKKITANEEKKIGTILVPEMAEKLDIGEVMAVGIGEYAPQTGVLIPMECQVGEHILFIKEGAYIPLNIEGEWFLLMRENNVECRL
jgi:chaperonin GroES